jgi:hypothetical protein
MISFGLIKQKLFNNGQSSEAGNNTGESINKGINTEDVVNIKNSQDNANGINATGIVSAAGAGFAAGVGIANTKKSDHLKPAWMIWMTKLTAS